MGDPIDIKTKKTIPQLKNPKFDKFLVLENLEQNIVSHYDIWGNFQQIWVNKAYKAFKDFDKYIVLMFLIRDYWQSLANKFNYLSMDEFYDLENIKINKINLINISNELHIPKETIRRKVNELQDAGILSREGKSISLNKKVVNYQKHEETIDLLSSFIQKKSNSLKGNDWFGAELRKEEIKEFIKKYFTITWLRFFNFQIPYLIRHRDAFKDIETFIVWGNIALGHQHALSKTSEKNLIRDNIRADNYYRTLAEFKIMHGINASSIADISGIPRATVIRKLKWLIKNDLIKRNKKLEYQMKSSGEGKLRKVITQNIVFNQTAIADFLTDMFDFIKNSQFKL